MPVAALHLFDPTEGSTRKRRVVLPDFLREDELNAIITTAENRWKETRQPRWRRARQRDWCMILTAYYCGLRVAELCRLEVQDIDLSGRLLVVRKGKGCKDGTVPISAKLAEPLAEWIGDRTSGVVFADPRGGHLDHSHFRFQLKGIAKKAGVVRRVHPHIFRHTAAVWMLRRGADIYEVSRFLRHSGITQTAIYLHLVPGRLAEAAELL